MRFKFDEFAKYIHKEFASDFTIDEIKDILYLENDGYNISIPDSHQKRLLLNRIILKGKKENAEAPFIYDRQLFTGVSMWIADNLKGKSTIFKAIGYALTGRDRFTPMMKSWLKEICLQFTIHDTEYTVILNLTGSQLRASVYKCSIDNIESTEEVESFRGKESLAAYMQELFFKEFNYYPIKRVQATQSSVNLSDADLSWVTYYSSIYHQSKDYGNLEIGNQHSMVFQMLLGLQYTYSIHALDVKARKEERDWSLKNEEKKESSLDIDTERLRAEFELIEAKIKALSTNFNGNSVNKIEQKIRDLQSIKESKRKNRIEVEEELYIFRKEELNLQSQIDEKQDIIRRAGKEIKKQNKQIIEFQEYIDSGIFFNDLIVTECPHCEHEVDKNKLKAEKESKICMLCDHKIEDEGEDTLVWQQRISEAQDEILNNQSFILKHQEILEGLNLSQKLNQTKIETIQQNIELIDKEILNLQEEINPLDAKLTALLNNSDDYFSRFEELVKQKVSIENKLELAEKGKGNDVNTVNHKKRIEVLRRGHSLMLNRRRKAGEEILKQLEVIMLGQLHALGLPSYTAVEINPDNFIIRYHQGSIISNFTDISEGEQLRAKLALYLSLIELDLSTGLGRHPRLIILDSPTKEEGDLQFVEGLKNALLHIEKNFSDRVQVMVGTANRELRTVMSDPEKLEYRDNNEFMF